MKLLMLMLMVFDKNTCVIFGSWLDPIPQITAVHHLPVLPRKSRSGNMSIMSVKGCVCKLTLAQLSLRDPLPDDAAGIVDHSGRLELHGFHHIAHTDLQRQGNHDCRFAAPPTSHLFTGTASVSQRRARSQVKQRSSYSDCFPTILRDDY